MVRLALGSSAPLSSVDQPAAVHVADLVAKRTAASQAFFTAEAPRIARLCSRMADRFAAGGRLIAIGASPAARSDARHVAVEFVHPVIVGKRALPALGLTSDTGALATQVAMLVSRRDMLMAFGDSRDAGTLTPAIAAARNRGCLTIANDDLGAETQFTSPTDNPFVWQELVETLYHVLWELVHVFLEHVTSASAGDETHPGASAFLYPFLTTESRDVEAVILDVTQSVVIKANETTGLRERALAANTLLATIAELIRSSNDRGGCVLAFGNGGSATDAVDFVADLISPPTNLNLLPVRALDLTDDSSIITALSNDVGPEVVFARQIIAYGTSADVAVGFSTSGSSANVIAAFAEARRRGIATVAFTGYDGGRIAAESLADHVVTVPSQFVPRIQEVHATAYHIIRSLVG